MNFEDVEQMVIKWAKDRSIFEQSNPLSQMNKLQEELNELGQALCGNNHRLIKDGIGDMLVVLTIIAHFNNYDLFECLCAAYLEIKDRKGKMINGVFVKES